MWVVWCLAWMTAMMDPMGLNTLRHEIAADRMAAERAAMGERGPANAALERLRARIGQG
jgi:hypothetical protein